MKRIGLFLIALTWALGHAGAQGSEKEKGELYFSIVDQEGTDKLKDWLLTNPKKGLSEYPKDFIPQGRLIFPYRQEFLVIYSPHVKNRKTKTFNGRYIASAKMTTDQYTGQPLVLFTLSKADLFYELTKMNVGSSLAVVYKGKLYSHAKILDPIPGGNVQMSGFSKKECEELLKVFNGN